MSYLDLPLWKQFLLTCEDHLLGNLILFLWLRVLFHTPSAKQLFKSCPCSFFWHLRLRQSTGAWPEFFRTSLS